MCVKITLYVDNKVIQPGANVSLIGARPKQPVSMVGNQSSKHDSDDATLSPPPTPVNVETPPQHYHYHLHQ